MQDHISHVLEHLEVIQDELRMQPHWGVMGAVSSVANYSINKQSVTTKERFEEIGKELEHIVRDHPELDSDLTVGSFIKGDIYQDYMCQRRKAVRDGVDSLIKKMKALH